MTTFEYLMREKHLYHRDIKPDNILILEENSKFKVIITDFGVSKALQTEKFSYTVMNSIVGTPYYLSPKLWEAYSTGNTKTAMYFD